MNEKIKEIGELVGLNMNPQHLGGFPNEGILVAEEFAKAVIEECIKIGEKISKEEFEKSKKPGDIFEYKSHAAQDVVDSIKEHFDLE